MSPSDAARSVSIKFRNLFTPGVREVLLWCLPALIIGISLRIRLTATMPYALVQADSPEYLLTPSQLLAHHTVFIHGKRGFLSPMLFTIPFLLHLPALKAIPMIAHLLGLACVVMSGALARCWFQLWRWFIVPVTLWFAASPFTLWYEQTVMGESEYLCACMAAALAGTLWARQPTRRRFVWFVISLACAAGARRRARLLPFRAFAGAAGPMAGMAGYCEIGRRHRSHRGALHSDEPPGQWPAFALLLPDQFRPGSLAPAARDRALHPAAARPDANGLPWRAGRPCQGLKADPRLHRLLRLEQDKTRP